MTIPFDPRWEADHLLAMPFDQYQRYRLTAEILLVLKQTDLAASRRWTVLDVGGYFPTGTGILPLPSFVDDEVLVIDTADYQGSGYRRASGTELPFADTSFDVVTTCDTLEHIPANKREAFLAELRRVARRAVILAAPHATPGVNSAEAALAEYLRSFGYTNQMLDEHLQYGIPEPAWVDAWLRSQDAAFVAFPSGYLPRWQMMMHLKHQLIALPEAFFLHERLDQTYNQRFYDRDQRGPGYRRVYVISAGGEIAAMLQPFVDRAARPEAEDVAADLAAITVAPMIRALTHLAGAQRQNDERLAEITANLHQLQQHYSQLAAAHSDLLTAFERVAANAGVVEGEKRVLQQQLDMLAWQNQLLHTHLQSPGRRTAALLGRFLHGSRLRPLRKSKHGPR